MDTSRSVRLPILAAGIGSAAGFLLRLFVLKACTDENHLLNPGSLGLLWLILFAAAVVAALTLLVLRLPRVEKGADAYFTFRTGDLTAALPAAALLLAGGVCELLREGTGANLYLSLGAVLSALLLAVAVLRRGVRRPVSFWLVFPVCVWAAVKLILDFKDWSFDPRVIDFCYRLFSDVSALLALHFLSGFSLRVGKSRAAVLWSLLAYVFAVASVPDCFVGWGYSLGACLSSLGLALLLLLQAIQLLREPFKPEPVPEEPAEPSDEAFAPPADEAPELPDITD